MTERGVRAASLHEAAPSGHEAAPSGHEAAPAGGLGELYARHAPAAVRTAYLLTSDRELAEDIAQDAFVRLAGRFRHLRSPEAFPAYLRKTVVNLSLSRLRRRGLERKHAAAAPPTTTWTPQTGIEERDEMWSAISALPPRQRAVVVLRYYEDLSESETADMMRCSVAAVKSLVQRAFHALRETVGSEET